MSLKSIAIDNDWNKKRNYRLSERSRDNQTAGNSVAKAAPAAAGRPRRRRVRAQGHRKRALKALGKRKRPA